MISIVHCAGTTRRKQRQDKPILCLINGKDKHKSILVKKKNIRAYNTQCCCYTPNIRDRIHKLSTQLLGECVWASHDFSNNHLVYDIHKTRITNALKFIQKIMLLAYVQSFICSVCFLFYLICIITFLNSSLSKIQTRHINEATHFHVNTQPCSNIVRSEGGNKQKELLKYIEVLQREIGAIDLLTTKTLLLI